MHANGSMSRFSKANLQIMSAFSGHLEQLLKMLCKGLVGPHLRFCWRTCGVTTRSNLERLQDRAIRVKTDSPYDAPATEIRIQLGLPSISEMIHQEFASMVFKVVNGQATILIQSF